MPIAQTYEPIATTTLGSAGTITFSSIPNTYTDLVLVLNGNGSRVAGTDDTGLRLNSDSGSNYSETLLQGNGSSVSASRAANVNVMFQNTNFRIGGTTGARSTIIYQFMNYANTNTYKTVIARSNVSDFNTTETFGLWRSTAAIDAIYLYNYTSANFTAGTTATL
jgi:hypothetical protein